MSLSPLESMVSRVGVEPTTSRLRVRIAPVSLSCAELPSGRLSVAESGLLGFDSSAECRPVRLSSAELSTASQPRFSRDDSLLPVACRHSPRGYHYRLFAWAH